MGKQISEKEGEVLLKIARQSIFNAFSELGDNPLEEIKMSLSKSILEDNRGIFVSLHKKGRLRGCIGNIEPVKTIFEGIVDNARHAAFKDSRFNPMGEEELNETQIEISILTRPRKLEYQNTDDLISQLTPGVDGVIIEKGHNRATFLPQVWDQLKRTEDFLGHLCRKAGLQTTEWQTGALDVSTYQVQLFSEAF